MLLEEATQMSVFSCTFIFNTEDFKTRIIIGRIQGVPSRYENGDVIIKELTKNYMVYGHQHYLCLFFNA